MFVRTHPMWALAIAAAIKIAALPHEARNNLALI